MADDKSQPELSELREAIEAVDHGLLELLRRRRELSEQVASAKIQAAAPFRDQLRAEQVLQRVRQAAIEMDLDPHQVENLFREVMEISISQQQAFLEQLSEAPLRVAYQGVEGSYSHITAQRRYAGRPNGVVLTGYETFRMAAESVLKGINDLALLPIENSTAGSINETYDLLTEGGLQINAEEISQVRHCLLALPGASMESLRQVLSHPQALMQCERFLASLEGVTVRTEFDTAGAAQRVRDSNDPTLAAIASASAAAVFGLQILQSDIQNQAANFTRFVEVAIEAAPCPPDQPCKTSLLLATGHHPGDLGEVLREFAQRGVNLTKLESRPVPETPWRYRFYLDIEGHAQSSAMLAAFDAIAHRTNEFRVLGTYPRSRAFDALPEPPEEAP